MSDEEMKAFLKANGAGRGLFDLPPLERDDSLAAIAVDPEVERSAEAPGARPRWVVPVFSVLVPAALGTALLVLLPTQGGTTGAAGAGLRERIHTQHEPARRGVYMELDMDDIEFYDDVPARAPTSVTRRGTASAKAEPIVEAAPAEPAAPARRPAAKSNPLADLGSLGTNFAPVVVPITAGQSNAAKREASFMDLTRSVRRMCRSAAEASPSSVLVRARVVVGKTGSASDVTMTSNSSAVGACVEREIRAYRFADEARLGTIEIPFSWRKQ